MQDQDGAPPDDRERTLQWHACEPEDALRQLETKTSGLTSTQARKRLETEGLNRLPARRRRSGLMRFLLQFQNLLIYVLIAAAILSIALGHPIDAAVIAAVVLANALIGYVQEGRAEQALEAINAMIDPKASVMRDGQRKTIPAEEIVRGDIVLLEAGDRASADLRILRARNLKIDEAILTGESVPVEKQPASVAVDAVLADRTSMAYSGCFVASGQGVGLVVATGVDTELGRISALLSTVESLRTPLIVQMDQFARHLTVIVIAVSALALVFALLVRNYTFAEAFMTVVGLAVAAIPEGLPAILTITLAIGVRRMATRNAIIRKLPAVETLGSVSVICSDKTGTLTRNEMTARTLVTATDSYEAAGVGYEPRGSISRSGHEIDPSVERLLSELCRAALLCNDASLREDANLWLVDGDPMEGALVSLGHKAGFDPDVLRREFPRIDEIPFDSQHRFMATLHADPDGGAFVVVKGAPEQIIMMCSTLRFLKEEGPLDRDAWHEKADELAAKGQRVLGFAAKRLDGDHSRVTFETVESGLALIGLVGFIDPPRTEAIEAIAECRSAGIRVVMITGDHAVTAREVGQQLGLARDPVVLSGSDVNRLDDHDLGIAVQKTAIFARTTPEHKLRLVAALQANGLTVAMTGDGVNDAPALKRADVGVAMGQKGTEAAKEAAEMVLADDNFASIVAAVREGRTVYDNLIKVIGWTLPTNGGEALTILAALALGATMPITPVQILWVNLITAVALGLTLAFEPAEAGVMTRPPRSRNTPILSGELAWKIFFVSTLFVAGAFGMFAWGEARGLPVEETRTLVVNTFVSMEIFYLFSVRYAHGSSLTWQGVFGTKAVLIGVGLCVGAQLAFTYLPLFNVIFSSAPVSAFDLGVVIGVGVAMLAIVEIEKTIRSRLRIGGL